MADSKRKDLVDNLERQKRASNICVTQVPESTESEKVRRDNEDRLTIIDLLKLNPDDVKHVFRAGAVQDKPRPLIAVMSSPDMLQVNCMATVQGDQYVNLKVKTKRFCTG